MKRYGGYWRFENMLDFCYLVNPYFPPQKMLDELQANFSRLLTEYPSGMFVNSLLAGRYFNIKQDYVVVGNGAAELIKSLMERETGKTGMIYPTFEEYPHRKNMENIVSFLPKNKDLRYTIQDLMLFYDDKNINSILLINPDNPSGNFIEVDEILFFLKWCKRKCITLILDESFVDFSENWKSNSLLHNDILEQYYNLVVVKSISKSYGVPGLRLGVLASSNVKFINSIKKDISIWNINSFAEFYMQIFNKYDEDYKSACDKLVVERFRFIERLKEISYLRVIPSQANFVMCEVDSKRFSSLELTEILLSKYNILIKNCDTKVGLKGKNMIRIAIRNSNDNDILIDILKKL